MAYTTDNRIDPRPEVRTGPTYVKTEKSSGAGWLIAGIVIVAAIVGVMLLAPFDRTVTTTTTANPPAVENNVTVQPPAETAPSTTKMDSQPAAKTAPAAQPATPAAPAIEPAPAAGQPAQPAAPAANQ